MTKLLLPNKITTITLSCDSEVLIKLTNTQLYKLSSYDGLEQTVFGYKVIWEIISNFKLGKTDVTQIRIASPNGPARRSSIFLKNFYYSRIQKLFKDSPEVRVDQGIPILCSCCTKYSRGCKEPFHKQAYMAARTILTAIPSPAIDDYDDPNEIASRDEEEY